MLAELMSFVLPSGKMQYFQFMGECKGETCKPEEKLLLLGSIVLASLASRKNYVSGTSLHNFSKAHFAPMEELIIHADCSRSF